MEAKQTMLLLSGLPGSGKSKAARAWVQEPGENPRARINYDDLRIELFGPDFIWNRKDEELMKKTAILRAERLIESGHDLVVDNCNLHEGARGPWKRMASKYAMELVQEEVDTPIPTCIAQDRQRWGRERVGRAVIERMALFNGFIDWTDKIMYPRDFIIVDMDGTVADCSARKKLAFESGPTKHRRDPDMGGPCLNVTSVTEGKCLRCGGDQLKDWDLFYKNVEKDPPIKPIVDLVRTLAREFDILVVSGRPTDVAGKGTEEWLDLNLRPGFSLRHLFMRAAMDHRPDFIIKKEILDLLPKDRIRLVLDDRAQVVKMWRAEGLTCLQVAEGDF